MTEAEYSSNGDPNPLEVYFKLLYTPANYLWVVKCWWFPGGEFLGLDLTELIQETIGNIFTDFIVEKLYE